MAQKDRINPLTWNRPISDAKGWPTREFQIKWEQLSKAAIAIPSLSTPAAVSAVLDVLSGGNVNGSILVRSGGMWNGYPSPSNGAKFLAGTNPPTWQDVDDADLVLSDVLTNNVSTTKHGFAPKLPNDATKYLDGTGAYSVPAGGGGGSLKSAVPIATSAAVGTSLFATQGVLWIPSVNMTVSALVAMADPTSGMTYCATFCEVTTPGLLVTGAVTQGPTVTPNFASTEGWLHLPFTSPVSLTAGSLYLLAMTLTSSTDTTAPRIWQGGVKNNNMNLPGRMVFRGQIAKRVPASGDTVNTDSNSALARMIGAFYTV